MSPMDNHVDEFIILHSIHEFIDYIELLSRIHRLIVITTFDKPGHEFVHPLDGLFDDRHLFLDHFDKRNRFGMNGVLAAKFSVKLQELSLWNDFPPDFTAMVVGDLGTIRSMFMGTKDYKIPVQPLNYAIGNDMFEAYLGLLREFAGPRPIYAFNINNIMWIDTHDIS